MAVAPQFSFDLSTSKPFSMTTSRPAAMSAGVGLILISGIMPTHYTLATYSMHTQNRLKLYAIFTLKLLSVFMRSKKFSKSHQQYNLYNRLTAAV
jgi:hypothetical protein